LAAVDGVALLGIVGSVAALVLLSAILWDGLRRRAKSPSFTTKLLVAVLPLIVARQIGLPSKVEFLFPLLIVFLLAAARDGRSTGALAAMAASLAVGSLVQVSLLDRSGSGDALHFQMRLNPGAVAQDFDRRVQNATMFDPAYLAAVARASYGTDGTVPTLQPRTFFPGLISDTNDLVIGAPALYQLDNPRFVFEGTRRMFGGNGDSRRSAYRHIYVCDKSVAAAGKGWRTLQPPPPIARLDPKTGQVDTQCSRED
jgi:ABC-type amino acid transport substrate-binding protein